MQQRFVVVVNVVTSAIVAAAVNTLNQSCKAIKCKMKAELCLSAKARAYAHVGRVRASINKSDQELIEE